MKRSFLAVALISVLATACSAEEAGSELGPDAGGFEEADAEIIGNVDLNVQKPPVSTYYGSVPVTGTGPANGTLLYTTAGGGQFIEDLGSNGAFCVDVILQKNATNTIKFEAIDADGNYSDPVLVDVQQSGEPPDQGPVGDAEPGYTNIVSNATVEEFSVSVEEGAVAGLTDGDKSGFVSLRNAATGPDWMVLELNERLPIEQINIETTGDCALEDFNILLNDDPDSEPPIYWSWAQGGLYVYGSGWTMVASVRDGGTSHTITPTIGGAQAHRMAIEFLSGDCGPLVGTGRHKITEIEVWARGDVDPNQEPTSDGAPSCAAGNF